MKIKKSTWFWLLSGIVAVGLRLIASPEMIERLYSRGIFIGIRNVIDYTIGWLPIPLIYIFVIGLVAILVIRIRRFFKLDMKWQRRLGSALLGILTFISGGIFLFLILWGYNYGRLPLEQQLNLKPQPLTIEELRTELETTATELIQLRAAIPAVTDSALTSDYFPADLEHQLRASLTNWLQQNGYPTPGRVRGRTLFPKGIFLRFSSSGLYFPFTGEGNVDAGLLHLQRPFVMAHELSHGYGFGDEGLCNFLGYMACMNAADPVIQYCGKLGYYRYVASDYLRYHPEAYQEFRAQLPLGIPNDLNAINTNLNDYPDIMPRLRYAAYDTYLKTQGITEGMKNYNRIVMLKRAYEESNASFKNSNTIK
ncbi:MAG: DUF3810 domain-containing protein [Saprospiraceae bacterium]